MAVFKLDPEAAMRQGICELHGEKGFTHTIKVSDEMIVVCPSFFKEFKLMKIQIKKKKDDK